MPVTDASRSTDIAAVLGDSVLWEFRFSVFPDPAQIDAWNDPWRQLSGEAKPRSIVNQPDGSTVTRGIEDARGVWIVTQHANRPQIDFVRTTQLRAPSIAEGGVPGGVSIAPEKESAWAALGELTETSVSLLAKRPGDVVRLAVGAVLGIRLPDLSAFEKRAALLLGNDVSHFGEPDDFIYRVNDRRRSEAAAGTAVNRIRTYAVAQYLNYLTPLTPTVVRARSIETFLEVSIDINTSPATPLEAHVEVPTPPPIQDEHVQPMLDELVREANAFVHTGRFT